jgi:uncharacterized membrane protein YtjA (UPF0391 family)
MLYGTVALLLVAATTGLTGFGDIVATTTSAAQALFFIFVALLALSFVAHLFERRNS